MGQQIFSVGERESNTRLQPYNMSFKFNNGRMYCSELVYIIYKEQFGIELCKPRKVSSYRTFGLGWLLKKEEY